MIDETTKHNRAKGYYKRIALAGDTTGAFQELVTFNKLASAETDKIKAMINKKFGPGSMKYGSQIPQPPARPDVIQMDAINAFMKRNPAAEGGQMVKPSVDGSRPGYSGRKGSAEDAINRRTKLADDYNKIVEYALNNRKIKNFSEPVEVTIDGKLTTIDELPTVNEWADMNNVDRSTLSTRKGSLIPVKRAEVYKTIVDETIKLNNQTFTYSSPSDIAMDIGFTKNQGRGTGVEDLLRKGDVTKLLSKDEIVSNYIQHLIDKDAPLKDFTNNSIFKHINSRNADLIKISKDKALTIPSSAKTIDFNRVSKIMKANHPELFAKIGRDGQIPFLSRSIQNKTDLGNMRLSEAFQTTESGDIFFNEAKAKNINVKRALANITAETDILQGKLKLDQKSLAISNAQDKMVTDLNKYIRENPNVILDNPQFRNLAATRFEDGKFIIDEDPKLINDRLNRYIKSGFFSTDHKVSKRTGKLNIEFPTNKQIVPTFINGPIRSMENYIANNISKYDTDPLIKNNIDEIVNVAKTNNFTVNVPKGNSKIFGTNRTNVGAIADMATVSADGTVLTSYDNQLKKFNFDIDKIPELSNVKNIDYTEVDKSKLQKTLDTKLTTAQGYTDSLDFNKQAEAYVTDTTGKVKQPMLSSGFSGAYEMLSDDLKAITNTEGFKKFSKIAKTPGKFFGIGDVALGYLDYKNNIGKGDSEKLATKKALQAMSFGLWKGGDREYLNELKETYVKNGGDESVFDQVISLNKQNSELMSFVEKTKEQYQRELENEKTFGTAGGAAAIKFQLDVPSASDTLKTNLSAIKTKAENMDKDFTTFTETYKGTDLTQPSKDIKAAAFEDLAAQKRKVFDTQSKQLNTEAGPIGNWLLNNIFTTDARGKTKEQAYIDEMAKNYPQELYRYNLERGVDPDNPVTFDATSNLISKPELGFNFSEGGITTLRSKYEYKK